MTNESGENPKLSERELGVAKNVIKKSLEIVTKKGKEDPNSPSDDEQLKEKRKNFLKKYTENHDLKTWGQEPPPVSKAAEDPGATGYLIEEVIEKKIEKIEKREKNRKGFKISDEEERLRLKIFRNAIDEYENSGAEREYWQASWEYYGARIGLKIKVPECDRTMEEKRELEEKGRKLIYVPPELSTPKDLGLLNDMHTMLQLDTENIINEKDVSGWIDVEASPNTPRKRTTENELREQYKNEGLMGMNLNVYIISSLENKYREGIYFDAGPWVRLLGSSKNGKVIDASFRADGSLGIDTPSPETTNLFLGGRSMGVKKTTSS